MGKPRKAPSHLRLLAKEAKLQRYEASCGAYALRHAMLLHGIRPPVRRLMKLASCDSENGITWNGLAEAAKEFDFCLERESYVQKVATRSAIKSHLQCAIPILIPVDKDERDRAHWVTIVSATSKIVTVVDSGWPYTDREEPSRPSWAPPAFRFITWDRLLWRMLLPRVGSLKPSAFILYPLKAKV